MSIIKKTNKKKLVIAVPDNGVLPITAPIKEKLILFGEKVLEILHIQILR